MNFGAFEWTLVKGIAVLVALDPARHEFENLPTAFGRRVDLFDRLARERISEPPLIETHTSLIRRIKRVAITRNSLLHGPWFDMPGTDIDAEKSKLVDVPIRLADLLKPGNARSVTPLDIHAAMLELRGVSVLLSSHLARIKETLSNAS
jgi:hypothetical protein